MSKIARIRFYVEPCDRVSRCPTGAKPRIHKSILQFSALGDMPMNTTDRFPQDGFWAKYRKLDSLY